MFIKELTMANNKKKKVGLGKKVAKKAKKGIAKQKAARLKALRSIG